MELAASEANLQVAVRGSFGEWRQHRLHPRQWADDWLARFGGLVARPIEAIVLMNWPARLALAGGVTTLIFAALALVSGSAPTPLPTAAPLPTDLAARAPLFTEAWLNRDMPQMLRFTEKSRDRQLRQWSGKTLAPLQATAKQPERKIEVLIERREPHSALVTVRIAFAGATGAQSQLTQRQQWVENDSGWYFLPALPSAESNRRR
jgi:hypothetical protein